MMSRRSPARWLLGGYAAAVLVLTGVAASGAGAKAEAAQPGGRIAFGRAAGNVGIYVMSGDGSGLRRLTRNPGNDGSPAWSPDGRRIAFTGGAGGISVVASTGGRPRLLTKDGDQPTWSPGGSRITFGRWRGNNPEIAVMTGHGTGQHRLTRALPYELDGYPSWTARMPKPSTWVVRDLGTLGGRDSFATDVNGRGQVVGAADTGVGAVGVEHAFLWQSGKMHDLDTLGDPYIRSTAVAINERGQVVVNTRQSYPLLRRRAFLWDKGALTEIDALGGKDVFARAINERGEVIGTIDFRRAFLWHDGVTTDLGGLGGATTSATAIDDKGQIVGTSQTAAGAFHAFLWENGQMRDLGTLGGVSSTAIAVNARGWIVGSSETASARTHAFLWAGQMRDLGAPGRLNSTATAINDRGQIVGTRTPSNGNPTYGFLADGVTTALGRIVPTAIDERGQIIGTSQPGFGGALLWEDGVVSGLGTLGGPSRVAAINGHDQVVGTSTTGRQATHAVLWTRKASR